MMKIFKPLLVGYVLLIPFVSLAGVSVYKGTSGEKLFIEEGTGDTAYVKIEGIKSAWAGHVIKTAKATAPGGDRYSFDYKLELTGETITRSYMPIVSDGQTLVKGTVVKKLKFYYSGGPQKGVSLTWDEKLTDASQNLDLEAQYKKSPFTPEVE